MKAAVLENKEMIVVKDVPVPEIRNDEVLVQVKACGVCGTDILAYKGDYMPHFPLIMGHEFSGIVVKTKKEVSNFKKGDRVTVWPDYYCHKCINCQRGFEKFCSNWQSIGFTLDGAYAEYISVREENLFHLPDTVSFDEGTFIEPANCVYQGIKIIPEYFDKRVLIIGAGAIGLIHLVLLKAKNTASIDLMDISDEKLEFAKQLEADNVFNTKNSKKNLYDIIKNKYDVIFDCSGVPEVIEKSFDLLETGGHFILFGVAPTKSKISLRPYTIYEQGWNITGVFSDNKDCNTIINMIGSGKLNFKPIISHRFKLDNFLDAFKIFLDKEGNRRKMIIYN